MRYTRQSMNTTLNHISQGRGEQVSATKATLILLGLDVHANYYSVVRKRDGQLPQPPQKLTPSAFLEWMGRQQAQAERVIACYEAGPLGFWLARALSARGVTCYVIAPQNLDERHQRVKTDGRDATALVGRLDRFVHGNREALAVVRVPTPEEEQRRSQARLRQALQRHRQRLEAQGRGYLLYYGLRVRGRWWRAATWTKCTPQWPAHLVALLTNCGESKPAWIAFGGIPDRPQIGPWLLPHSAGSAPRGGPAVSEPAATPSPARKTGGSAGQCP